MTAEPGEVTIAMIHLGNRYAALDDGTVFTITNLLDSDGDETDDEDDAVAAVGQLPNGLWVSFDLRDFGPPEPVQ